MNQRFRVLQELGEQFERVAWDNALGERDRRTRRHSLRRPRVLAAVLVALLLICGAAAAITLTGSSSAPVRLANGSGLCPVDFPYVADTSQKLFYAPNYPGLQPRKAVDTRCFASMQDARAAGYTTAPPPAGDTMLGSLYLAPAPAAVRHTCQAAQRHTRAVVYCPSRLPVPWTTPVMNPNCPTAGCSAPLLSIGGSFTAPSSYVGWSGPGVGEVTMWTASAWQLQHYPVPIGCGFRVRPRPLGHTSFRGYAATWYQCAIFGNTPSSVLEWRIGQESYGITANGPAGLRHRLVKYIAAHLVALPPHS